MTVLLVEPQVTYLHDPDVTPGARRKRRRVARHLRAAVPEVLRDALEHDTRAPRPTAGARTLDEVARAVWGVDWECAVHGRAREVRRGVLREVLLELVAAGDVRRSAFNGWEWFTWAR